MIAEKEIDRTAVGNKIKSFRERKGVLQKDMAEAIGVTAMAVSQWERGERMPNDSLKVTIAAYFGTTVSDIFFTHDVIKSSTALE